MQVSSGMRMVGFSPDPLVRKLEEVQEEIHTLLETDIGGCLMGIAGGCGACTLCDFDDIVDDLKKCILAKRPR